ncbi:threonine-phosphate decarboxylase CobD [Neorhizobium sp. T786]|uniref:threonine-phosphate decarboxylase CobD n=1 Tax=Pseudorhizobium xiangyangii TaxID=2883104 RepID=UPI001D000D17|nr:threonine-phosphate decarboxylase CobD [Neorhizobium xiangyangii]MCB5203443.1 threonine-phosphate decarboxylase CobD [Neorhizobium xiangyangii]
MSGSSGPIQHGGNLARARALFPQAPEPWLDLSTGINPHSYLHSPVPATAFSRLPEPGEAERLKLLAAEAYGAPSLRHVAAGPGTQILLPIVARLVRSRSVAAILSPTYAEHARAARLAGYEVREVSDPGVLAEANLAVVVNPNNPTGRTIPKSDLLDLAAQMRSKGGLLVVDEAFHDVAGEGSVADAVDAGGLLVLRSFGKFYGMAGVRLGFAISHPDVIARVEEKLGPWAVSGPALHIANEALGDHAWKRDMRARLQKGAARLDALLAERGVPVTGGTSLFRYVQHSEAQAIFSALGRNGVLVRRFEERPMDLRIGLPGDDGWERLQRALEDLAL